MFIVLLLQFMSKVKYLQSRAKKNTHTHIYIDVCVCVFKCTDINNIQIFKSLRYPKLQRFVLLILN